MSTNKTAEETPALSKGKWSDRRERRRAINEAARASRDSRGGLPMGDYAKIWRACRNDQALDEIWEFVEDEATAPKGPGLAASEGVGAFDWLALVAFIQKILPLILQIIDSIPKKS